MISITTGSIHKHKEKPCQFYSSLWHYQIVISITLVLYINMKGNHANCSVVRDIAHIVISITSGSIYKHEGLLFKYYCGLWHGPNSD